MSAIADFMERVRDARINRGWSQARLADYMTQSGFQWLQTTVAKMELGQRRPWLDEALFLAGCFGLDLDPHIPEVPPVCPQCLDTPPGGFTCNECRREGMGEAPTERERKARR